VKQSKHLVAVVSRNGGAACLPLKCSTSLTTIHSGTMHAEMVSAIESCNLHISITQIDGQPPVPPYQPGVKGNSSALVRHYQPLQRSRMQNHGERSCKLLSLY
jgi:hypothetical protein